MITADNITSSGLNRIIHLAHRPNILVVDADQSLVSLLGLLIRSEGSNMIHASDTEEAITKIKSARIDLVITEFMLKSKSSLELFTLIRKKNKGVPIFVVTAYSELISEKDIKMFGADELFLKPLNLKRLRAAIRSYSE